MSTAELWLEVSTRRPNARQRLICFPHAGGSASFFAPWAEAFGANTEVCSVAYPGRAARIGEALAEDLVNMAKDISAAVREDDRPCALFGHSFGAVVALEVARDLQSMGRPPLHLFASGSFNGPLPTDLEPPSEDPNTVAARLVALGGTTPELANDPIFREFFLSYTIGDSRLFHAYQMDDYPALSCGITTIVGDVDDDADRRPWARLTEKDFLEYSVPGNHFYLVDRPPFEIIQDSLETN